MSTYNYNYVGLYSLSSGTLSFVSGEAASGSLQDGLSDGVFSLNESLFTSGSPAANPVDYSGNVVDSGETILFGLNGGLYYAFVQAADPDSYTPPASISLASLSTADFPVCFLSGVRIATPTGDIVVERLSIGDLVLTSDGHTIPVKWVGRQTVVTVFGPPENHRPVLVEAGALGEGLPTAGLRVTSDHALLIDGVLVQAGALVNGTTVRRLTAAELGERYVVYHVETEGHEVIVAEGMPAETFVDNVTRRRFDNYAEYLALYGEQGATIAEIPAPRVKSARQLPQSIRERVAERARALASAEEAAAA